MAHCSPAIAPVPQHIRSGLSALSGLYNQAACLCYEPAFIRLQGSGELTLSEFQNISGLAIQYFTD